MRPPLRAAWIAALLLAVTSLGARAAIPVPPELQHASEEEIAAYAKQEGERSLREKLQVGRERYQERLALRQSLAEAMRTNCERRRGVITTQLAVAPPLSQGTAAAPSKLVWIVSLAIVGGCIFLHFRSRRAQS